MEIEFMESLNKLVFEILIMTSIWQKNVYLSEKTNVSMMSNAEKLTWN